MSEKIKSALSQLDAKNDNHWTADGLPRLDTLKLMAQDPGLTREAVNAAAPGFNRTLAAQVPPQAPAAATPDTSTESPVAAAPAAPTGPADPEDEPELPNLGNAAMAASDPSDIEALDRSIADQRAHVEMVQRKLAEGKDYLAGEQSKLDALIDRRTLLVKPGEDNHKAIQAYLARQRQNLAERAERQQMIAESGVNLRELAKSVARSPLDQTLSNRRRGK